MNAMFVDKFISRDEIDPARHGTNGLLEAIHGLPEAIDAVKHEKKVLRESIFSVNGGKFPVSHGKLVLGGTIHMAVTTTEYQRLAEEIRRDLAAVTEKIKRLEGETPQLSDNFIRAYVNVPIPFLQTAVSIVDQEPQLQAIRKLDSSRGHDTLQFLDTFRHVHDDVGVLGRILKKILIARKADLAARALQIYAVVRGMARNDPRMADHARNLGRDLGPRGAKRKAEIFTEAP